MNCQDAPLLGRPVRRRLPFPWSEGLWSSVQAGFSACWQESEDPCGAVLGQALSPLLCLSSIPLVLLPTRKQPRALVSFTFLPPHFEGGNNFLWSQKCPILFFVGYDRLLIYTMTLLSSNCHSHAYQDYLGDFPGGPVVRILHSQRRRPRFDPWLGN